MSTEPSAGRPKHVVALLILPDSLGLEVALAQQIFGRQMPLVGAVTGQLENPYELVLCGEASRHLLPSGMELGGLAPLSVIGTADTVIVPGVEDGLAERSDELLDALRSAHTSGTRMVSFCVGAFILAKAGILDGKRATTHWLFAQEFEHAFPHVRLEPEHLYIDDDTVHTSGGMLASTDLALHLLALDFGQLYANDFSRLLVSAPHRPGGQSQYVKSSLRIDDAPLTGSFLQWIRDNLHNPLSLADLAEHQHISKRSLIRKFRQENGLSVFDWISQERVSRAKVLLESTDFRVSEVAAMVGFGSTESLRRNFDKIVGTTAMAYRSVFRPEKTPVG